MEGSSQLHDPTPLPTPDTQWQGGWVGATAGVDAAVKILLFLLAIKAPSPRTARHCTGQAIREQDFHSSNPQRITQKYKWRSLKFTKLYYSGNNKMHISRSLPYRI
jgi:hypothetical protein